MKKIIIILMVICFTSAAQAKVSEYYTVEFNKARIPEDTFTAVSKNETEVLSVPMGFSLSGAISKNSSPKLDIYCSPNKSFMIVSNGTNAQVIENFATGKDCLNVYNKINKKILHPGSADDKGVYYLVTLKVRFNPATNDISFEY